jgi:hypothetical protein
MVKAAQQDGVGDVAGATIEPREHVMGVGVARGTSAVWPPTATVALAQELALGRAEESSGTTEVGDHTLLVKQQCSDLTVTSNACHRDRVEGLGATRGR